MKRYGDLRYSDAAGEGDVRFRDDLELANNTIRLDTLQDWITELTDEYARIHAIEYGTEERTAIANTIANTPRSKVKKPSKDG